VLDVPTAFQTVTVAAGQTAISESGSFDKVTANDENHVVLVTGSFASATLGNGGNEAILAASFNMLSVGNGDNSITLTGSSDKLAAGDGNNTVVASDTFDTVRAFAKPGRRLTTATAATARKRPECWSGFPPTHCLRSTSRYRRRLISRTVTNGWLPEEPFERGRKSTGTAVSKID
jgi:hypothetical protein